MASLHGSLMILFPRDRESQVASSPPDCPDLGQSIQFNRTVPPTNNKVAPERRSKRDVTGLSIREGWPPAMCGYTTYYEGLVLRMTDGVGGALARVIKNHVSDLHGRTYVWHWPPPQRLSSVVIKDPSPNSYGVHHQVRTYTAGTTGSSSFS